MKMLLCLRGDDLEIVRMLYDDFYGTFTNINGVNFMAGLDETEQENAVRALLAALPGITGDYTIPRLSFSRVLLGEFWAKLEKENLLYIDSYVQRLPFLASYLEIETAMGKGFLDARSDKLTIAQRFPPVLIIIAGPNGAGKSTFHDNTPQLAVLPFVNADNIAKARFSKVGADETLAAQTEARGRITRLFEKKDSFCFETVFSHKSKIELINTAKELGYTVDLYILSTDDVAINISRVKFRVAHGGHDVPIEKIKSRWPRTDLNLKAAIELVDRYKIIDTSDGVLTVVGGKDVNEDRKGSIPGDIWNSISANIDSGVTGRRILADLFDKSDFIFVSGHRGPGFVDKLFVDGRREPGRVDGEGMFVIDGGGHQTFIQQCLALRVPSDQIEDRLDDFIEDWHSATESRGDLHECIGLTVEQYGKFLARNSYIVDLVEDHRTQALLLNKQAPDD
jgi:predicted ABC-type ATPase